MSRPRFVVAALLALVLLGLNAWSLERSLFRKLRRAPRLVTLVATIAIAQGTLGIVTLLFNRNAEQAEQIRIIPTVLRTNFVIGDLGVTGGDIQAFIIIPLITIAAAVFFRFTRFGVAVRAAAENSDSARLLGISVDRVAVFTWVAGSVLAGVAGILLSAQQGGLNTTTLSVGFLVRALAAALIGGLTSLPGALDRRAHRRRRRVGHRRLLPLDDRAAGDGLFRRRHPRARLPAQRPVRPARRNRRQGRVRACRCASCRRGCG